MATTERPRRRRRRKLSKAGAHFIATFEGFRSELYDDAAGHCTIGFGHLVHHGRCDGGEPRELRRGVTRERALELLQEDAKAAADAVNRVVEVPLSQPQFDALVSFVFNVGAGAFGESTLLRMLNEGRYRDVPRQLDRWVKGEREDARGTGQAAGGRGRSLQGGCLPEGDARLDDDHA